MKLTSRMVHESLVPMRGLVNRAGYGLRAWRELGRMAELLSGVMV